MLVTDLAVYQGSVCLSPLDSGPTTGWWYPPNRPTSHLCFAAKLGAQQIIASYSLCAPVSERGPSTPQLRDTVPLNNNQQTGTMHGPIWTPLSLSPAFQVFRPDDSVVRALAGSQVSLHEHRMAYKNLLAVANADRSDWEQQKAELVGAPGLLPQHTPNAVPCIEGASHLLPVRYGRRHLHALTLHGWVRDPPRWAAWSVGAPCR